MRRGSRSPALPRPAPSFAGRRRRGGEGEAPAPCPGGLRIDGGSHGMSRPLRKILVFAAMAFGLPLVGIWIAGEPVARYLEFPPTTRYVEHAPFSLPLFFLGVLMVLVPLAPFVLRAAAYRPEGERYRPKAPPFPSCGSAGG